MEAYKNLYLVVSLTKLFEQAFVQGLLQSTHADTGH
jgi:hypothetical protein